MVLRSVLIFGFAVSLMACNSGSGRGPAASPEEDLSKKYPGLKTEVVESRTEIISCKSTSKYLSKDDQGKESFETFEVTDGQEFEVLVHQDGVAEVTGTGTFDQTNCFSDEVDCGTGAKYKRSGERKFSRVSQATREGNKLTELFDASETETLHSSDYRDEKAKINLAIQTKIEGVLVFRIDGNREYKVSSTRNGVTTHFNEGVVITTVKTEKGYRETSTVVNPIALENGSILLEGTSTCDSTVMKNKI